MKTDMATGRKKIWKLIVAPPIFVAGLAACYVALGAQVSIPDKDHPEKKKVNIQSGAIDISFIGISALLFWGALMVWNKK